MNLQKTAPPVKGRIMIIDDEPAMGRILVKSLNADGFSAVSYVNPLEALEAVASNQPDVILSDVRMPGLTGDELLRRVKAGFPEIPVIIMTAFGAIEDAVEMLRLGAFNYITKPFQHANLVHQIELATEKRRLEQENLRLSDQGGRRADTKIIIGGSEKTGKVRELIQKAASTDSVVLITGESGVGKELIARQIHDGGARAGKRFVAVNCPAIPPSLIESEMFGYERGAFTGADRPKMGLIELSAGGTLFLDEIGEIPSELQVKLLRVIQEREVQRVGGLKQIPIDLRIIAATNRNLEDEVRVGRFRADLYYRLKVIVIEAPPLRERVEDIPELVEFFMAGVGRRLGRPNLRISPSALRILQGYPWPGNIRELENAIERMATLGTGDVLNEKDIPAELMRGSGGPDPRVSTQDGETPFQWPMDYKDAREQFERSYLRQILRATAGNMAQASRLCGISRRHLYEKLSQLGMEKDALK